MSSAAPVSDPSASAVVPGALLANKYRVERVLGQGGMGYVVEARHITLDERVALKFLLPEYAKHPEASARFLREARAAVKIKSEHVARVSDVGTMDSGAPYMVMEFLDGADLAHTLQRRGVLSVEDALDYILQACDAIAEAHSYGIVHRDLKPANLFLAQRRDGSPLVKVLDFGISKVIGGGEHALTKTTTAMGSALYMSPEQMQETKGVDQRTDVYSMGIALFELLAGRQPFYAETLPALVAEVLTGVPTPLTSYRPDIPGDLGHRLERAYERDKNKRYQSISEFAMAIAPYAPERSRATIERLARMGGFAPPPRSEMSSAPNFPVQSTTAPILATTTTAPQLNLAPTVALAATGAPNTSSGASAGTTSAFDGTASPAVTGARDELPPQMFVEKMPPIPELSPVSELRIEPGSYRAPISTNAAAAFAKATKPVRPRGSSRKLLASAVATATVFVGLGGFFIWFLRSQAQISPEQQRVVGPPLASEPVRVEPVPSANPAPTAPQVVSSADKPPPTDVRDAGVSVDAGSPGSSYKTPGPAKAAPTAQPTSKAKNPDDYLKER